MSCELPAGVFRKIPGCKCRRNSLKEKITYELKLSPRVCFQGKRASSTSTQISEQTSEVRLGDQDFGDALMVERRRYQKAYTGIRADCVRRAASRPSNPTGPQQGDANAEQTSKVLKFSS